MDAAADNPPTGRILPPADVRALSRRSDLLGALQLAIHLALIAGGVALVAGTRGTWLVLPAMLALGWPLVALFAVVHECVHYTAFRTRWVNDVVAWLAATPSLLNSTFYKHFHYAHHRHCQDPARDPELTPPAPETLRDYVLRMASVNYWRTRLLALRKLAQGDFGGLDFIPVHARAGARRSMVGMWAFAAIVLVVWLWIDPWGPLLYWFGPLFLAQPILRTMLLAEHTGCSEDANGHSNTRTTLVSWPVRLVHWNMPFHAEHHLYPSIPFHALPAAHARLRPHLVHVARGYGPTHRAILKDLAAR